MVVKVLISGISASKEVKKRQQRAQMLLDSHKIKYDIIDITEPGHEDEKQLMRTVCKKRNNNSIALPPQFFNDDQYCGDYEDLELASDDDMVLSFLKLEEDITIENGDLDNEGNDNDIDIDKDLNGHEVEVDVNEDKITDEQSEEIISELVDEKVVVEERLTIGGKVVDIPADKMLELLGNKLDLNELLIKKAKKIEDSDEKVDEKGIETKNDNQMDVQQSDNQEVIESNDNKVEENQSNEEEDESDDENNE